LIVCPRCHAENREGRRFCGECGLSFASTCPSCGFLNEGGEKFCGGCGRSLTATASPVEPRFSSPQTYIPKHLAERILTSKAVLEGERKQVTVLFADLKASMELLADRDPEDARKLLDPVLERMMEAVHRYEGTVNQVMGDGIMALFGAPLAHEEHAVRACYAALRMQESIKRYVDEARRTHGVNLQIRVGLNSGEVVVRAIGSDLHMDYTAVGQTTHLAARMEQLATPGTILLTANTSRLVEGFVQVNSLGSVPVRGLADPVKIFELLGVGPLHRRFEAAAARGLTSFVGRESELDVLRRALERARVGHGQIVAPVGEPGVGKSRLFWEFTHSESVAGWLILESGSVSYGKATAYLPVIDLLKAYFNIQDRDDHHDIRAKITNKLLALDRAFESMLPVFLALLDLPVDDSQWRALHPRQRRRRTLDAVKHLLLRESLVQPLLLVFEDLHWIDSETEAILDRLVESLPTARILLLVNYRPEYHHAWGTKSYYTQLHVNPLPPERAEELIRALLGDDHSLAPLKQMLIERTDGNPLFLEESVRTLIETRALTGEPGRYRVAQPIRNIQVPASVQAILAARIDRLPADQKHLLQAAAVIGGDVPFVLLQAIAGVSDEALRTGLTHLQAGEFLYEAPLVPDLEYTFKHAVTYEVAYGSLLVAERRRLHAEIVEAIEQLYADRLSEHIERLADHAFRAEAWAKAVDFLRQAGAKAFARSAHRAAVAWFEQALLALDHLPEDRERLAQAIDLRLELRAVLFPLGEFDRILSCLREAENWAHVLDDQRRLARVCAYLTDYLRQVGDYDRAIEYGVRGSAIAAAQGDAAVQVATTIFLGHVHHNLGDYQRGSELLRSNLERLVGDLVGQRFGLPYVASVHSRTWLAWCLVELGEFAEARTRAEEGLLIAETLGTPPGTATYASACSGLGRVLLRKGELGAAIPLLERGRAISDEFNLRLWWAHFAGEVGYAYALTGRVDEGVALLQQSIEQWASMRGTAGQSVRQAALGEAYLLADRIEDADRLAGEALALARRHHERGHLAYALRLLAEVAGARGPRDRKEAERHYGEALAMAQDLSMRPLVAQCHLGLANLYRQAANASAATEHVADAIALFSDMAMPFWLERAEAERKLLV